MHSRLISICHPMIIIEYHVLYLVYIHPVDNCYIRFYKITIIVMATDEKELGKLLRTTRTVLLLNVVKGGSSLQEIEADYLDQKGEPHSWKKFNYPSLINFLESHPEFFERSSTRGKWLGKTDDKNAHQIRAMTTVNKSGRGGGRGGAYVGVSRGARRGQHGAAFYNPNPPRPSGNFRPATSYQRVESPTVRGDMNSFGRSNSSFSRTETGSFGNGGSNINSSANSAYGGNQDPERERFDSNHSNAYREQNNYSAGGANSYADTSYQDRSDNRDWDNGSRRGGGYDRRSYTPNENRVNDDYAGNDYGNYRSDRYENNGRSDRYDNNRDDFDQADRRYSSPRHSYDDSFYDQDQFSQTQDEAPYVPPGLSRQDGFNPVSAMSKVTPPDLPPGLSHSQAPPPGLGATNAVAALRSKFGLDSQPVSAPPGLGHSSAFTPVSSSSDPVPFNAYAHGVHGASASVTSSLNKHQSEEEEEEVFNPDDFVPLFLHILMEVWPKQMLAKDLQKELEADQRVMTLNTSIRKELSDVKIFDRIITAANRKNPRVYIHVDGQRWLSYIPIDPNENRVNEGLVQMTCSLVREYGPLTLDVLQFRTGVIAFDGFIPKAYLWSVLLTSKELLNCKGGMAEAIYSLMPGVSTENFYKLKFPTTRPTPVITRMGPTQSTQPPVARLGASVVPPNPQYASLSTPDSRSTTPKGEELLNNARAVIRASCAKKNDSQEMEYESVSPNATCRSESTGIMQIERNWNNYIHNKTVIQCKITYFRDLETFAVRFDNEERNYCNMRLSMNQIYGNADDREPERELIVRSGEYVCVRFKEDNVDNMSWHRAKITEKYRLSARVHLMDLGGFATVRKDDIFYLDEDLQTDLPFAYDCSIGQFISNREEEVDKYERWVQKWAYGVSDVSSITIISQRNNYLVVDLTLDLEDDHGRYIDHQLPRDLEEKHLISYLD